MRAEAASRPCGGGAFCQRDGPPRADCFYHRRVDTSILVSPRRLTAAPRRPLPARRPDRLSGASINKHGPRHAGHATPPHSCWRAEVIHCKMPPHAMHCRTGRRISWNTWNRMAHRSCLRRLFEVGVPFKGWILPTLEGFILGFERSGKGCEGGRDAEDCESTVARRAASARRVGSRARSMQGCRAGWPTRPSALPSAGARRSAASCISPRWRGCSLCRAGQRWPAPKQRRRWPGGRALAGPAPLPV